MTHLDGGSSTRRASSLLIVLSMIAAVVFAVPPAPASAAATSRVQFVGAEATFIEASTGPQTIEVELVDDADDTFSVDVVVLRGTAVGSDYGYTTQTLTFTNGETAGTTRSIDLGVIDDGDVEGNESVILGLDNFSNGGMTGIQDEFVAIIQDDDGSAFSFRVSEVSASELAGSVTLDVVWTGAGTLSANAFVITTDDNTGTATENVDYVDFGNQSPFFLGGSPSGTVKTVTLTITDDGDIEPPETIDLSMFNSSSPLIGTQSTMTLTIEDDDSTSVSVTDASASEADGSVDFTLTLSSSSIDPVDVSYVVTDIDAALGSDYSAPTPASPITFAPGETSKVVSVPIVADDIAEGDETFSFELTGAVNANLGNAVATGTITNDDIADLVVTPLTVDPVVEGSSTAFDISLATEPVGTVDVAITSADPGVGIVPALVSFDAGTWSTPVTVTVTPSNDDVVEGPDSATIDLDTSAASDAPYDGMADAVVVGIDDNDVATVVFDSAGPSTAAEGTAVNTDIRLDLVTSPPGGSLGSDVTPVIGFSDTSTTAADYSDASSSLTFSAGSTDGATVTASIVLTLDGVSESTETFDVTLDSVSGPATIGSPAAHTIEILDQDDPVFEFDLAVSSGDEGTTALVGVRVDVPGGGALPGDITVNVGESVGSTADGADRTFTDPTPILFSNGTPSGTVQSVSIPLSDDSIVEAAETLELELSVVGPTGVLGAQTAHTLTINETQVVTVEFDGASSAAEGGAPLDQVQVVLDAGGETLDIPVTVEVVITGGTAEPADHGFTSPTVATFTGATTSVAVPLATVIDTLIEGDETIDFELQSPSAPATIGAASTTAHTILDLNAAATITIGTDATVLEDAAVASVDVTLNTSGGDTLGEPIDLAVVAGVPSLPAAVDPDDFGLTTPTITFPAGSANGSVQPVSFSIVDDGTLEPTEEALFDISAISGPVTGPYGSLSLFIEDNDPATVAFTDASGTGTEGGLDVSTSLTITIPGGGTLPGDVTVDFAAGGGSTAADPDDYTTAQLVIPAGTADGATVPVGFPIVDDLLAEIDEVALIELVHVAGPAVVDPAAFQLDIPASDEGVVEFDDTSTPLSPSLAEGSTADALDVVLILPPGVTLAYEVTATVSSTGGSAVDPDDFTFSPQLVTFPVASSNGATVGVPVTVASDTLIEGVESITFEVLPDSGPVAIATASGDADIADGNTPASIDFALASSTGAEDAGSVGVDVVLTTDPGDTLAVTVTVPVEVAGGTAIDPDDYSLSSTSASFPPGSGNGTVHAVGVDIVDDTANEVDEDIELGFGTISAGPYDDAATQPTGTHTFTILDDDAVSVDFAIDTSDVTEGASATIDVVLSVPNGGTLGGDVTVTIEIDAPSTDADAASHDVVGPITVDFFAGDTDGTVRTVTVVATDDSLVEVTEDLGLRITGISGPAVIGPTDLHVLSILEGETVTVEFAATGSSVAEGVAHSVDVNISITNGDTLDVAVGADVSIAGGTAVAADHVFTSPETITFLPGTGDGSTLSVTIDPQGDTLIEGAEGLDLALGSVTGPASTGTNIVHRVIIEDANSPAVVGFAAATSDVAEGAGSTDIGLTLAVDPGDTLATDLTVDAAITGGDATTPGDLTIPATVIFAAGSGNGATADLTVSIVGDGLHEADETATIELGILDAPATVDVEAATHDLTILDDDPVVVAFASTSELGSEGTSPDPGIEVSVPGGGLTQAPIDVTIVNALTGTAGPADASPPVITIPAGTSDGAIISAPVPLTVDTLVEGTETLDLSIDAVSGPATVGIPTAATIEIEDVNAATVSFLGADPLAIAEDAGNPSGQFALVAISMAPGDSLAAAVTVAVVDGAGTAVSTVDYEALSASVSFPPGTVDGSVELLPIDPIDDGDHEATETILLSLGAITGPAAAGIDPDQTIEITDDDPVVFEFATASSATGEVDPAYGIDVTITVPGGGVTVDEITVPITLSGTAEPADLGFDAAVVLPSGTPSGVTTVAIDPVDDDVHEGPEIAVLTLGSPTGPGVIGDQVDHTVTISDPEDVPEVSIGADITDPELDPIDGSNSFEFAVTLSNPSEFTITVDYSTAAGTAIEGTDYLGVVAGTVTFAPLDVEEVAPVAIPVDLVDEVDGDFTVTLSDPVNATLGGDIVAIGTILDDDNVAPTITSAPDFFNAEGSGGGLSVVWSDPGGRDSFEVAIDWGDGTEPTASGTLPPGTTSFFAGHTYTDDGEFTITFTVTDVDGGFDTVLRTAFINNVTPSVGMPADFSVDEGDLVESFGSYYDPGADTWTATVNYGDGTGTKPLVIDPFFQDFELEHIYADDGIYTITVCVQDDEGAIDCDLTIVDVGNVAPASLDLGPNQSVSEGAMVTVPVSFSDPGSADTHTATVDWGDATPLDSVDPAVSPFDVTHVYASTGVFTVTVCVEDDEGATTCDSIQVSVDNAAPVVDAGVDFTIDEGDSASILATFTDPDVEDTHTATVDWGDGTVEPLGAVTSTISASHVYPDSGTYTVTLQVDDSSGAFGVDTVVVTVDNVDPSVAIIGVASGDEGSTLGFSLDLTDPSPTDVSGMTYDWEVTVDATIVATGTAPTVSYTPDNDGAHTLTITVTDPDGGVGTDSLLLTIANVAPTGAVAGIPVGGAEGTMFTLVADAEDVGPVDDAALTYAWDVTLDGDTVASGTGPTIDIDALDDGLYEVELAVFDDDTSTVVTDGFTISNLAPMVAVPALLTIDEGSSYSTSGTWSDPGVLDTHSATVDYGDGSGVQPLALGIGTFDLAHTYADQGSYLVIVCITDDGGASECDFGVAIVNNVAPTSSIVGAPVSVDEGTTIELTSDVFDPGVLDVLEYTWVITSDVNGVVASGTDAGISYTPADDEVLTVTLDVSDGDGGAAPTATATITVDNVAPVIDAFTGNPNLADEGDAVTFGATITDPGADDLTYAWDVLRDGDPYTTGTAATLDLTVSDDGSYTVNLVVTDDDGGISATFSEVLVVANVAPLASITDEPADPVEGTAITLGSDVVDPGADTFTYLWDVQYDGGTYASGTSDSITFTPADDGAYDVTLTVLDDEGAPAPVATLSIAVANVAPTLGLDGVPVGDVDEGTAVSIDALPSDVGVLDVLTTTWSVTKNGDPFASGSGTDVDFTPDDDGTYEVTAQTSDADGGTSPVAAATVTVVNVTPSAVVTVSPETADEGETLSASVVVTDPGSADTFTYAWTVTLDGDPFTTGTGEVFEFEATDDGEFVVQVVVTDDDGGTSEPASDIADVSNVAPVGSIDVPVGPFVEGDTITLNGLVTDPGSDDEHVYSWLVTFGGDPVATGNDPTLGIDLVENGVYQVTLTVVDDDLAPSVPVVENITVSNAVPVLELVDPPSTADEGDEISVAVGVSDLGVLDTSTVSWSVTKNGDPFADGSGSPVLFTPDDEGTYAVAVDAIDDDGGEADTVGFTVEVANVAPVVELDGVPVEEVDEGSVVQIDALPSDAGPLDLLTTSWSVTKNGDPYASGSGTDVDFTPDDDGVYEVGVSVSDEDGGVSPVVTATVTVVNVAPSGVATVTPDPAFEGDTLTASVEITDPGADTFTYLWTVTRNGEPYAGGTEPTLDFALTDDGVYAVAVTITDDDGGVSEPATDTATASNLPPVGTITGPAGPFLEGDSVTLTGLVADAGVDDTHTFSWLVTVDGETVDTGTDTTLELDLLDDGEYQVTLVLTDDEGASSVPVEETLIVQNVAPSLVVIDPVTAADEGDPIAVNVTVTEPGLLDVVTVTWEVTRGGLTYATGTGSPVAFTPDDDGTYVVEVDATDDDGGAAETQSFTVEVANVAPTGTITGIPDGEITEGDTLVLGIDVVDPGTADEITLAWSIEITGGPVLFFDESGLVTEVELDLPEQGEYTVAIIVADEEGGVLVSETFSAVNAVPVIDELTIDFDAPVATLDLTVVDPGTDDTHIVTINWGDGVFSIPPVDTIDGTALVTVDHEYEGSGIYLVEVCVLDDDGATACDITSVEALLFGESLVGDFDGNGTQDLAQFHPSTGTWFVDVGAGTTVTWGNWVSDARLSGSTTQLVGDFNGDGRDDIANFTVDTGQWWVNLSTGTGFTMELWSEFTASLVISSQFVGDFNGDGRDDLANFEVTTGRWWISRSTGVNFTTSAWAKFTPDLILPTQLIGDFNGDGNDDLANFEEATGKWWISISNGSDKFGTSTWMTFSTGIVLSNQFVGDFNGDGRDDLANFEVTTGKWFVSLANGSSGPVKFDTSVWSKFTPSLSLPSQFVGDFNGDGLDDIANFEVPAGKWWVSLSNGSTKFNTSTWSKFSTGIQLYDQLIGDFDGDGRDDLANLHDPSLSWFISRSTGSKFATIVGGSAA